MKSKEVKLTLQGLDCANCANKIEKRVNDLEEVKEAVLNFTSLTLTIELNNEDKKEEVVTKTKEIINILEPHVKVRNKEKKKEIYHVNPGKEGQSVILRLPIEVQEGWILRRKK